MKSYGGRLAFPLHIRHAHIITHTHTSIRFVCPGFSSGAEHRTRNWSGSTRATQVMVSHQKVLYIHTYVLPIRPSSRHVIIWRKGWQAALSGQLLLSIPIGGHHWVPPCAANLQSLQPGHPDHPGPCRAVAGGFAELELDSI